MREFSAVLGYTFREHIRKKSFVISTVIILLLTVLLMLIPAIISEGSENGGTSVPGPSDTDNKGTLYLIDRDRILGGSGELLKSALPGYAIELKSDAEAEGLKAEIKNSDRLFLLITYYDKNAPAAEYYFNKYGSGPSPDELSALVKNIHTDVLLKSVQVPDDVIAKVAAPISFSTFEQGKGAFQGQIFNMLIMILLFFAVYFYGYWIAMSVASEKTSRVMEILVTSAKPSSIIFGKSAAMGLLGLLQLGMILLTAGVAYRLIFPENFTLFGQQLNFSEFTPFAVLMIFVYFVLGYALFAMLNAVAGATVSKAEDVNTALMPISIISLVAFYFAYMSSLIPDAGGMAAAASIIPFSSPFSMPGRLLSSDVPPVELVSSLLILIATTLLLAWVSVRIYSSAVLHYGKRLKLSELIGMAKK